MTTNGDDDLDLTPPAIAAALFVPLFGSMRMSEQTIEKASGQMAGLARSLIKLLGYDGALRACRANLWHGVLRELDGMQPAAKSSATGDADLGKVVLIAPRPADEALRRS